MNDFKVSILNELFWSRNSQKTSLIYDKNCPVSWYWHTLYTCKDRTAYNVCTMHMEKTAKTFNEWELKKVIVNLSFQLYRFSKWKQNVEKFYFLKRPAKGLFELIVKIYFAEWILFSRLLDFCFFSRAGNGSRSGSLSITELDRILDTYYMKFITILILSCD